MTPHPLAKLIPSGNVIDVRALRSISAAPVLQTYYGAGSSFVGAFTAENSDAPSWAQEIAKYDRDEFHKDNPSVYTRFSQIVGNLDSLLPQNAQRRATLGCYPNFRHALDLWIAGGRQGAMPYTEFQDYGSCVDASRAALFTMLLGVRASNPANREILSYIAAWYWYANRGYCSDGWSFFSAAKIGYQLGLAFRKSYPEFNTDFSDDDENESIVARKWCRSGVPSEMASYTKATNPCLDGCMTEFDTDDNPSLLKVFEHGGGINTGGTNTSGGHGWCKIGRVGGHEQCGYGADNSEQMRKFGKDKAGVTIADDDFVIIMDQTWGEGFGGECPDSMWPVGVAESGEVLTMAEVKSMLRAAANEDQLAATWGYVTRLVLADEWGWGLKPQGAWVWRASDIRRYFGGDIFACLPLLKGVPDPNPMPVPPTPPTPTPPAPDFAEIVCVTDMNFKAGDKIMLLRKSTI